MFCLCMSVTLQAQENDNDDSKYLAGAVPEVDGKVVFTREFSIPGMSQEEIYARTEKWMDARLKSNGNNSRIVLTDTENKQVVGIGHEYIVFTSSALSLDRTQINYMMTISCKPESCTAEISKIRYNYREGQERYSAEEWITDKHALNKSKTKLVRGLAKWRRKTVDFVDEMAAGISDALSVSSIDKIVVAAPADNNKKKNKKNKNSQNTVASAVQNGPIVISQKKDVTVSANQVTAAQATPTVITESVTTENEKKNTEYKEIAPALLPTDAVKAESGKLVIVIGEEPFNMSMMTANAGGSLGKVNGKAVIFTILSPEQSYEQLEKAERYTVRFYPNGKKEPSVILECKKHTAPAAIDGMPRTYAGEIVKALMK